MTENNSQNHSYYDYIVIGCGGVGSSTLYRLAKATRASKETVLGIEQFQLGHDRGGSQDVSRIIRYAYTSDEFVALAQGAYDGWSEVEDESGIQLVYKSGGLDVAVKNTGGESRLWTYADSMKRASINYEVLDGIELHRKFPQFSPNAKHIALYQKDGGLVDAALANAVHIQLARKHGATISEHTKVSKITRAKDGKLIVSTSRGSFTCKKVVVTAGAWLNDVLQSVGVHIPVTVTQEQVTYFGTPNMSEFTYKKFPIIMYHDRIDDIYTLPIYSNTGFKIGVDATGPHVTADTRTFVPGEDRIKFCKDFLCRTLPRSLGPELFTKTCLYTMTSDRSFVIDTAFRTAFPDVVVFCGAGHAYKFAALFGKVLSQLAMDVTTFQCDIQAFSLDRPAITDPKFKKQFHMGVTDDEETGKISRVNSKL